MRAHDLSPRGVAVAAIALTLVAAAATLDAAALPPAGPDVATITSPAVAAEHLAQIRQAEALLDVGEYGAAEPVLAELVARYPADGGLWDALGYARYNAGDHAGAVAAYRRAEAIGAPFRAFTIYNLACSQALAGDTPAAVASLRRALAAGFEDRPFIGEDEDLAGLHGDPAWPELAGLLPDAVAAAGRDAGWRYDLAFWLTEVRRLHPDPFGQVGEDSFLTRVAELDDRIPALTDEQIMMELQKLTVLLGDGHSGIRPLPDSRLSLSILPVQLYAFADGLFVIDAGPGHEALIGSEVLRLGRRDVAELWPDLAELVARDNPMGLLDLGPLMLTVTATLRELGAIGATEEVALRLRSPAGEERTVTLAAGPMHRSNRELVAPRGDPPVAPPLFLAREDEVFWFGELPGVEQGLYVQFNVVRDAPDLPVAEQARRLRDHLQTHPEIAVIALDLRHNGGGNSFLYPPLVRVLVEHGLEHPDGRLYVLTGRRTFSACQNLATDLAWWTDAIFAGEPTGSRPNQIGESTWSRLPFSGLRAGISSRYHQQSYAGDDRPWIAPDLPVAFTAAAYFAGRDPVLEAVVAAESSR
jgi:tetratricopeptide (TPR) repeat protein